MGPTHAAYSCNADTGCDWHAEVQRSSAVGCLAARCVTQQPHFVIIVRLISRPPSGTHLTWQTGAAMALHYTRRRPAMRHTAAGQADVGLWLPRRRGGSVGVGNPATVVANGCHVATVHESHPTAASHCCGQRASASTSSSTSASASRHPGAVLVAAQTPWRLRQLSECHATQAVPLRGGVSRPRARTVHMPHAMMMTSVPRETPNTTPRRIAARPATCRVTT